MVLILFFLAAGYANNLIYAFFFFLVSMGMIGAIFTNRNIDRLQLQVLEKPRVFAKELNQVPVKILNEGATTTWELELHFTKKGDLTQIPQIPGLDVLLCSVSWAPSQRGIATLPALTLASRFPLGLLRAWKVHSSPISIVVFPERRGVPHFPSSSYNTRANDPTGLFKEHRSYQSTDSARRIDWRASVRRQELLVKTQENHNKSALIFSWDQTADLQDPEARLSQLALWIDQAEKRGHPYALLLEDLKFPSNQGQDHYTKCMTTLALMDTEALS